MHLLISKYGSRKGQFIEVIESNLCMLLQNVQIILKYSYFLPIFSKIIVEFLLRLFKYYPQSIIFY